MNPAVNQMNDLDLNSINIVIYWKSMKEVDVYSVNNMVKTYKGGNCETVVELLASHQVTIEVIE